MPPPVSGNVASALEANFPHIVQNLVLLWCADPRDYLDSLAFDRRGGRHGFPPEVMSEILFLCDLVWWRSHASSAEANDQVVAFSFADGH